MFTNMFELFYFKYTLGSSNFSKLGVMKYFIPFMAPGSVTALINKMKSMAYGKIDKK